jgi:adenylylsulfate kinase
MSNKMVLIMGLPGSGKTTFAKKVVNAFKEREVIVNWFNADVIREEYDDWDFSEEGRHRAAKRMRDLVNNSDCEYNVVDMVAPTMKTRTLLKPDYLIWMNTIEEGRFEDTNQMFTPPNPNELQVMIPEWGTIDQAKQVVDMVVG